MEVAEPALVSSLPIPKHIEDIRGRRFGRLVVIGYAGIRKQKSVWRCKCDCGKETLTVRSQLTSGMTQSCGCLKVEKSKIPRSSVVTHCDWCGKEIRIKKYRYDKGGRHYCDMQCMAKHREILMSGERNHQYGLKGKRNASFTSDEIPRTNNKLMEQMVYVGDWHKYAINGRVKKHRYIMEKNHHQFNPEFFEEIGGWFYLRKGIEVHHKDSNHNNNELPNLQPMTKGEHVSLHNKHRNQKRGSNGQFVKEMTLNEYQGKALETAIYPMPIIYPALGLCGESGEVADKVKKVIRDNNSEFTDEKKAEIAKEIGDVLWYCATLSNDIGYTLDEIAEMNYQKLHSRQLRGKLGGSGDNR